MASSRNVNGIIGVHNGRPVAYAPGKNFWKHDGFLPLQVGDQPVEFFTYGGGSSAPLDDGVYSGIARAITRMTAGADPATTEPVLQMFASDS
ncbi:hypothetical protein J3R83DRAFT_1552 [Lanmaoa asiatica]|nr:hypothetical protein J3R83DRAFT_1552 [Lanmaoa asiatica]